MRVRNVWAGLALVTGMAGGLLQAAAPVVNALHPAGGKLGDSFPITLTGNPGKVVPSVWTDHPGITFKPGAKPNLFEVTVAADTAPGPHLVRFFNAEGASLPKIFMVGTVDEVADTEPNDDAHQGQAIATLPITVNGRLDKAGDADSYKMTLQAGKWLVAALHGYGLGSQMDPAMRLLDEHGTELAMSHDTHNLDPLIAWEVKKSGTYVVQVIAFAHPPAADVNLKGTADSVYRLTLTQEPYARLASPAGVKRGVKTLIKPLGWNYGASMTGPEVEVDATALSVGQGSLRFMSSSPEPVLLGVYDEDVVLESEPGSEAGGVQEVVLPANLQGSLQKPGDEDRFAFTAKKGEAFTFKVAAASLHAPLDAWLRVENAAGKTLVQADDAKEGNFDPTLVWKVPADGRYVLAISDRFQRGGWDYVYQITTKPPPPSVKASLPEHAIKIEAGKNLDLKMTVELAGEFPGKLTAYVEGLPAGVTAKEAEVPAKKGGEITLHLTATPEAASSGGPVEVVITTSAPDAPATFRAVFDLRGVEPRGDRLVNEDSRLWLTVVGKPAALAGAATPPPAAP